jgi:hypothetical protein
MKTINIRPVKIIGNCPANLTLDDEFQIEAMRLWNPGGSNICFLVLSHFPISIWQLQSESRFFSHASCPGCISRPDEENRVVFLLGHEDKWKLCQTISGYLALCKQYEEPATAKRLKEEAIQHQNRGEYSEATQKMGVALKELERVATL